MSNFVQSIVSTLLFSLVSHSSGSYTFLPVRVSDASGHLETTEVASGSVQRSQLRSEDGTELFSSRDYPAVLVMSPFLSFPPPPPPPPPVLSTPTGSSSLPDTLTDNSIHSLRAWFARDTSENAKVP